MDEQFGEKIYPYIEAPEYPHMLPRDAEIWTRFIAKNPGRFHACVYDLHVGDGAPVEDDTPPGTAEAWKRVTQWRADVVVWDNDTIYVIEVKPNARASAIGQALGYKILAGDNLHPSKLIVPVVLTDVCVPETQKFADAVGVQIWCA